MTIRWVVRIILLVIAIGIAVVCWPLVLILGGAFAFIVLSGFIAGGFCEAWKWAWRAK